MAGGDRHDLVEAGECDVLAPNPRRFIRYSRTESVESGWISAVSRRCPARTPWANATLRASPWSSRPSPTAVSEPEGP